MKKIMVIILLGLTCVTMYFVVLWEPDTIDTFSKKASEQNKEEKIIKNKNEKKEREEVREREKNKEKEEMKKREEFEEREKNQKEKNKEKVLKFKKNLKEEDKKIIDRKIGKLSTVDLMRIEEFLDKGDLKEVEDLMKLRMLEADWKFIYEIFSKDKNKK